jgi:hypothetical protein
MYYNYKDTIMGSRTLCAVLEEMRKAYETRNFSYLPGLIEEAQSMGNRMESGLEDKHSVEYYREEASKARKEMRAVEKRLAELKLLLPDDEQEKENKPI